MASRPGFILGCVLVSGVLVVSAAGCGGAAVIGDADKVQIDVSQFDVSVKNTSGRALFEVRVEVLPVGRATSYVNQIPRIENAETRTLGFNTFTDSSGITFSPRSARPHAVAVTAKDINGAAVHVEVPWKKQ
ncbi:MAG: hypothetical protein NTY02_16635 [Acidobacteria bacterium]|nr:hypothetical protein [Acidobacteriota bacterium]